MSRTNFKMNKDNGTAITVESSGVIVDNDVADLSNAINSIIDKAKMSVTEEEL